MITRRKSLFAMVATAIVLATGFVASPAQAAGYVLINQNSGQCLSINHGDVNINGAWAIQYPCAQSTEAWNKIDPSGGYQPIKYSYLANRCLGITGGSTALGARAVIWSCDGTANQRWGPILNSDGTFTFKNYSSGLCLGVSGGSLTPGTGVVQYLCNGSYDQKWQWSLR